MTCTHTVLLEYSRKYSTVYFLVIFTSSACQHVSPSGKCVDSDATGMLEQPASFLSCQYHTNALVIYYIRTCTKAGKEGVRGIFGQMYASKMIDEHRQMWPGNQSRDMGTMGTQRGERHSLEESGRVWLGNVRWTEATRTGLSRAAQLSASFDGHRHNMFSVFKRS